MFGSYPYPTNFYNQNSIEFITIFVKNGQSKKVPKEIKELSKLSQWEWVNYTKQIWDIPSPNKNDLAFGIHSALMPEEIPYRLIKLYSYVNDIILDPFAGSGTTLKVAKSLDRYYIGYEIYNHYEKIQLTKINSKISSQNNKKIINKIIGSDVNIAIKKIEDNSVDLAIADPPYNQNIDLWDKFDSEESYFNFIKTWIKNLSSKIKQNGSLYIFE